MSRFIGYHVDVFSFFFSVFFSFCRRDVMWQGTTDDGCLALADLLGWKVRHCTAVQVFHESRRFSFAIKKVELLQAKLDSLESFN